MTAGRGEAGGGDGPRLRLAIIGATGRMGREVASLAAEDPRVELAGGIASRPRGEEESGAAGYPRIAGPEGVAEILGAADVVLDVSTPAGLRAVLDAGADALRGRALVTGTTGLAAADRARLAELAETVPVLDAANFGIGVNLLFSVVETVAAALGPERWDVEIVETHHREKADAPSGTALALAEAVASARGDALGTRRRHGRSGRTGERPRGEVGLHAVRGGGVVGEHRVHFLGARERVELAHRADDRALFAEGALLACGWIHGRDPGRYTMRDALGI